MTAAADRCGLHTALCSNKPYQCNATLMPLQSSHLQSAVKDVIVKLVFTPQSPLLFVCFMCIPAALAATEYQLYQH